MPHKKENSLWFFWILSQVQSYWFLKKKKRKAWTKGLFVSFRMPFCITAYLKASYIPDVLNWPGTPPSPSPPAPPPPAPLTLQPLSFHSHHFTEALKKRQYPKAIKDLKWVGIAFIKDFRPHRSLSQHAMSSLYPFTPIRGNKAHSNDKDGNHKREKTVLSCESYHSSSRLSTCVRGNLSVSLIFNDTSSWLLSGTCDILSAVLTSYYHDKGLWFPLRL